MQEKLLLVMYPVQEKTGACGAVSGPLSVLVTVAKAVGVMATAVDTVVDREIMSVVTTVTDINSTYLI